MLAWLRDHVHPGIPRAYYNLVIGHDLHISVWSELYLRRYHYGQADPFTGRRELALVNGVWKEGWWENCGLRSRGKVTVAFRDFEVDQLQVETAAYGDFKFHEVGLSTTPENNTHSALQTTSGIARATGTQAEGTTADIYKSVGTITADTTETWEEHGIFNASTGPTMMDRSLIVPNVSVVNLDDVEFTYQITKNAEA